MSKPEWYTIEESRALLFRIWPNWPDPRGKQPDPNVTQFLADYRAKKEASTTPANEVAP